jgi:hypothetical protein
LERFDEPAKLALWDERSGVGDRDERPPRSRPGPYVDFPVVVVVEDGVVEEVRDQPLEVKRVHGDFTLANCPAVQVGTLSMAWALSTLLV